MWSHCDTENITSCIRSVYHWVQEEVWWNSLHEVLQTDATNITLQKACDLRGRHMIITLLGWMFACFIYMYNSYGCLIWSYDLWLDLAFSFAVFDTGWRLRPRSGHSICCNGLVSEHESGITTVAMLVNMVSSWLVGLTALLWVKREPNNEASDAQKRNNQFVMHPHSTVTQTAADAEKCGRRHWNPQLAYNDAGRTPPVSSLGTVLEELLAGLLLEPVCTLNQHGLLHLRHVVLWLQWKKQKGTGERDDSVLMVKSTGWAGLKRSLLNVFRHAQTWRARQWSSRRRKTKIRPCNVKLDQYFNTT